MTPPVVVYGRQSKGDQTAIDDQIELQTKDALSLGWKIAGVLSDAVSASSLSSKIRDDWPKLREMVANGTVEYVCLWDASRGSRDAGEWLSFLAQCELKSVQIRITSTEQTYDMSNDSHWKALANEGVDADSFSRRLRRNTMRGINAKAAQGRPPGNMLYGYERGRDVMGRVQEQRAHPQRADVVRRIFKECAEGRSLARIAADLNAEGIPAPKGGAWAHATMRRIMLNRGYLGERWLKGQYVGMAIWPAIVTAEVFTTVGEILADPSRLTRSDGNFRHWLSGLATCAECGGIMRVLKHRGVEQYRCVAKHCVMIRKDELEEFVADEVQSRMLKLDEKPSDPAKHAKRQAALNEIKRLQSLINKVADDLVSGEASDYALAQATSKKAQAAIAVQQHIADANLADQVVRVLNAAGTDWFAMDPEQKRLMAQNCVTVRVKRVGKFGHHKVRVSAEDRVIVEDAPFEETEV